MARNGFLIIKKSKDKLNWDKEACLLAKLSDISARKLKTFLKAAGLKYDSPFNSLAKLKLLSGRKLLNAAMVLFAKKPQDFFPNAKLRCAVFGKTDTSLIIDRKEFEGDVFYLIERAQEYILENIHIGMRIEGLRRIDVPEIDKEAFREAIINAFCHRDYREHDSVNIAIFRDRVEIRNPGLLYGGLTIEKIKTEMVSERRNELLADLLHRVHFIEKWGRGISLMLSKEPLTQFKEVGSHFIVVFKRKGYVTGLKKKEDRIAIEKIIDLKQNKKIICIRATINTEYEIAKDNRQDEINQKWGKFIIKDACVGLKANLKQKDYDPKWDRRFEELKGICSRRHIDISILVQAEYFGIKYIISTDYRFIRRYNSKSRIVEIIRPLDFIRKIDIR